MLVIIVSWMNMYQTCFFFMTEEKCISLDKASIKIKPIQSGKQSNIIIVIILLME